MNTLLYASFISMILHLTAENDLRIETNFKTYENDNMKFHSKDEKDKSNWNVMETVVFLLPRAHIL